MVPCSWQCSGRVAVAAFSTALAINDSRGNHGE
jgi:hypothetical protein